MLLSISFFSKVLDPLILGLSWMPPGYLQCTLGNTILARAFTQCFPCHLPPIHSIHHSCLPPLSDPWRVTRAFFHLPFPWSFFHGWNLNSQLKHLSDLYFSLVFLLPLPLLTSFINSSSSPSSSNIESPPGARLASFHPTLQSPWVTLLFCYLYDWISINS